MVIRVKPDVGQFVVVNKKWFETNTFFIQFLENLKSGKVYKILKIDVLGEEYPDEWGISSVQDIETLEIFDIRNYPELNDYWCIFDKEDEIKIVEL